MQTHVSGRFLNWICGTSYGTFEDIRYKHFRHHMDNDDSVWFMCDEFFERHPRLVQWIRFLEWFYIPAHDLMMHFITVFGAFIIPSDGTSDCVTCWLSWSGVAYFLSILLVLSQSGDSLRRGLPDHDAHPAFQGWIAA